jgi:hypothetical protein
LIDPRGGLDLLGHGRDPVPGLGVALECEPSHQLHVVDETTGGVAQDEPHGQHIPSLAHGRAEIELAHLRVDAAARRCGF